MKTIVCFGDSNTFGTNPSGGRHPWNIRWPGRLQMLLGSEYHVCEEGMGGRTTVFDDPLEPGRCGADYLPVVLATHMPIDMIILSLGANDCKPHFHATPVVISKGIERLCRIVKKFDYHYGWQPPKMLLVSPAHILENVENGPFPTFSPNSIDLSRQLASHYERVAKQFDALFFDAASAAKASEIDRLHMDAESHISLAEALFKVVKDYFEPVEENG